MILKTLNETTYNQIRKDREILKARIEVSQKLLDEFNVVYPILERIHNPVIKIHTSSHDRYLGEVIINSPSGEKELLRFNIGKQEKYLKGKEDEELLKDAMVKFKSRVKSKYPEFYI